VGLPRDVDLLVVGGGINGAGIARDAAGRGLTVCLVERDDLASHTSSASTKLIHGGLRYLEQYEFRLVREALAERERLLAIAPHIIRPQRFVLPYVEGLRPRWLLRLGLFVYDHAGRREKLAGSRALALDGALGAPLQPAMHSGFEYADCWVEDSRLVVLNALDAAERGAAILTHTSFVGAKAADGAWLARCRTEGGEEITLRTRAIVNAAGAWVDRIVAASGVLPRGRPRLVKGSHLILPRLYDGEHAYLLQSPDRRVIFVIPFEDDFTLVGTTDVPFTGDPADVRTDPEEIDYLCGRVNRFFAGAIRPADVVATFAGVRALYDDGAGSAQQVTRDYHLDLQEVGGAPLLSVHGGKITTYRRLAEAALGRLAPHLGHDAAGWTDTRALPGGDLPDGDFAGFVHRARERWPGLPAALLERLARHYGTRMARVIGAATDLAGLGEDFGGGLTRAEVDHLVDSEWARTATDILERRTRRGLFVTAAGRERLTTYLADRSLPFPP
jgi:glycerol-3-phosphate dehydrogenase